MTGTDVTRGFGPPGSVALVVTHGFGEYGVEPVVPPVHVDVALDFCYVRYATLDFKHARTGEVDFPYLRTLTIDF